MIKATVITGFLGVGKTTFINSLIKNYSNIRFAIVENEFGEASIDIQLIKGVDAGKMFELKNGCICCTISNEYELVLLELSQRFPDVGHLIIETTGIADPVPVIQPFFKNNVVKKQFDYNGTICLVDSLNFKSLPAKEILLKQLAVADKVVVNKSNHLTQREKISLTNNIVEINPFCKLQFVNYGNAEKVNLQFNSIKKSETILISDGKSIHAGLAVRTLKIEKLVDREVFIAWLNYNLDVNKSKIFRAKGMVYFIDDPYRYILQVVGGSFDLVEEEVFFGQHHTEIVFIGDLDEISLKY